MSLQLKSGVNTPCSCCYMSIFYAIYRAFCRRLVGSSAFTSPQPNSLPILLQLGDQRVALLDHVGILLILIVRAVSLNDVIYAVNGTGYAVGGYKFGKITAVQSAIIVQIRERGTGRSRKSIDIPKAFAMLSNPTTR